MFTNNRQTVTWKFGINDTRVWGRHGGYTNVGIDFESYEKAYKDDADKVPSLSPLTGGVHQEKN